MTANTPTPDGTPTGSHEHGSLSAWVVPALLLGPLQTVTVEQSPTSTLEIVLVVVLIGVGSLLTYQAFRGYRRNDDRSMALFAIGLFLLTVLHAALKLASKFVVPVLLGSDQDIVLTVAATSQLVDIVGLVVVFYALLR